MATINYDMLKPIIVKEQLGEHNMIQLAFKTDDMENPIETVAVIVPDQSELMKSAMLMAGKSVAANMAVSGIAGMVGGALGSGISQLGSHVSQAVAGNPADLLKTDLTEEKKQQAIVNAFMGIQSFFEYDENTQKWKSKQPNT